MLRGKWIVAVAGVLMAALAVNVVAQDKAKPTGDKAKDATGTVKPAGDAAKGAADKAAGDAAAMGDEMMKKMMEAAAPGPHHKHLAPMVGKWTYTTKMWFAPGMEPDTSEGTAEMKWIMDGRFVLEEVTGPAKPPMNVPFKGMGLHGYDNAAKEYVSTWCDNMGTGMMIMRGTCSEDGKSFKMGCDYVCPMQGPKKMRMEHKFTDADNAVMVMYDKGEDGKEFKAFEITYKRAK